MLVCKNVIVNGRRTSMRLDKETWTSLADICIRQSVTLNDLCSKIDRIRGRAGLSSSTRLFVLMYFRSELSKYEQKPFSMPSEFNPNTILAQAS